MAGEWIDQLVASMSKRDLTLEDIHEAQKLKQRHFPSALFKYRTVSEYSLKNLRDSTLFLTTANKFNDPYDSVMDFDPRFGSSVLDGLLSVADIKDEAIVKEIRESDEPLVAFGRYVCQQNGEDLTDEKLREMFAFVSEREGEIHAKSISELNVQLRRSYKICSLSERLDSLPMWAHYAGGHTGFVMEYDFTRLPEKDLIGLSLWPVVYSGIFDASKILNGYEPGKRFDNMVSVLAALHKAPDWEYEKEWRLLSLEGLFEIGKCRMPLKAVHLGSKISAEDAGKVITNAKIAGVPVFKMRLVHHEFRMESVPLD